MISYFVRNGIFFFFPFSFFLLFFLPLGLLEKMYRCILPSLKLDLRDLQAEKTLLRKEAELEPLPDGGATD